MIETRAVERERIMRAVASGEATTVRRTFAAMIEPDSGARSLRFTISSSSVDRYGDTVAADGWNLANFRKNPVVLWMHNNTMLPVARATALWVAGNSLKATAEF